LLRFGLCAWLRHQRIVIAQAMTVSNVLTRA
jgi:hypothetical protein